MQLTKNSTDDESVGDNKGLEVKSEQDIEKPSCRCPLNPLQNSNNSCDEIQDRKNTHIRYAAFKYKTSHNVWPLQEPALKNLDDLLQKENYSKSSGPTKENTIERVNHRLARKEPDDPLWSMEPRIFAMEEPHSGKRRYIVCHLGRFMHHYWRDCDSSSRHYYELIRERTPCRLYFDLEFSKPANPQIEPNQIESLVSEFITELCTYLCSVFNITITRKDIVDLESSTDKKFSRHLIVHLRDSTSSAKRIELLFADAIECGIFVKSFVGRLAEDVATGNLQNRSPILAKCLFVNSQVSKTTTTSSSLSLMSRKSVDGTHEGADMKKNHSSSKSSRQEPNFKELSIDSETNSHRNKTCFIDTGVYTRNRLFRLMGSVKYGKPMSAALRVSTSNQYPLGACFDSTHFSPSLSERNESKRTSEDNLEKHAAALINTFVVPIDRLSTNEGILPKIASDSKFATHFRKKAPISKQRKNVLQQDSSCYSSPFPTLDQFVSNVLGRRGGTQGHIRACEIGYKKCSESENYLSRCILTYHMKGNRWCENINRSHKSNNIMWIVSIQEMQYWQDCYDDDCRRERFHGKINNLPMVIQDSIKDILLEEDVQVDDEFEKALLNMRLDDSNADVENVRGDSKEKPKLYHTSNEESDVEKLSRGAVSQDASALEVDKTRYHTLADRAKTSFNEDIYSTVRICQQQKLSAIEGTGDESFDEEFGLALMGELSANPHLFSCEQNIAQNLASPRASESEIVRPHVDASGEREKTVVKISNDVTVDHQHNRGSVTAFSNREESFDGEFGIELLKELSNNPDFFP